MFSLVLPQSIFAIPMSNQIRRDPNSNPKLSQEVGYREGYRTGRDSERLSQQEASSAREENSAASGLIIGFALASLAALAGGTIYFLNARNEPVQQTAPSTQVVPVPVPDNSQPRTSNKETTIIERTIDRTQKAVPVPQQPATNSDADAPNINIELPTPQQQGSENETNPSPVQPLPNDVEPQQQDSINQTAPSPVESPLNQTEPESSNNNE
jgi:hypothetical protein